MTSQRSAPRVRRRAPFISRLSLGLRVHATHARVQLGLRRHPLPQLVRQLGDGPPPRDVLLPARELGQFVHRRLRFGNRQPRCLTLALVHLRLLVEEGHAPVLVIGLPVEPDDHSAHAWVELDGVDVGPPPGRAGHASLVHYAV